MRWLKRCLIKIWHVLECRVTLWSLKNFQVTTLPTGSKNIILTYFVRKVMFFLSSDLGINKMNKVSHKLYCSAVHSIHFRHGLQADTHSCPEFVTESAPSQPDPGPHYWAEARSFVSREGSISALPVVAPKEGGTLGLRHGSDGG